MAKQDIVQGIMDFFGIKAKKQSLWTHQRFKKYKCMFNKIIIFKKMYGSTNVALQNMQYLLTEKLKLQKNYPKNSILTVC